MDLLQRLNILISEIEKLQAVVDAEQAAELELERLYYLEVLTRNKEYDV